MFNSDYIVVGSGLTGATVARLLKDAGYSVLVLERRNHVGGNVHDHAHSSGIRVHSYGPHYFRTGSKKIWQFVNRFASWYHYEAVIKTQINGHLENWPVTRSYLTRHRIQHRTPIVTDKADNFEACCLQLMPASIYERFVKGYTQKQWGVNPRHLSSKLVKRFNVAWDDDPRLSQLPYQGIPVEGYAKFMTTLLAGIPVILNCDFLACRQFCTPRYTLIYTGSIDQYYDYCYGKLQYRGQRRHHTYLEDLDWYQGYGQINNPSLEVSHVRTLEWKHMMPAHLRTKFAGTVITQETPFSPANPDEFEYPFPSADNNRLYQKYRQRAQQEPQTLICGRLGEYRYFDMDHAISRAMAIANQLIEQQKIPSAS